MQEQRVDIERCRRGMKQLRIEGMPRPALIAEAIARIHADPVTALSVEYMGIKNYAGFGDQREDHRYGFGPKHGDIVFRIGRVSPTGPALDSDAVYLLEAYRDFGTIRRTARRDCRQIEERWSLCNVIREHDRLVAEARELGELLAAASITSHESVGCGA